MGGGKERQLSAAAPPARWVGAVAAEQATSTDL